MTKRMAMVGLVTAVVVGIGGVAVAKGRGDHQQRRERAERVMRAELTAELGLDQKQADALFAAGRAQFDKMKELRKAMRTEREVLESLVDGNAPDAEIAKQLAKMEAAAETMAAARPIHALKDEAKKILTVKQQARLALLLPELRRDFLERRIGHRHGGRERGE